MHFPTTVMSTLSSIDKVVIVFQRTDANLRNKNHICKYITLKNIFYKKGTQSSTLPMAILGTSQPQQKL
jgi:hypothetical protein